MCRRAELLDVVEVAAVDDGEDSEQALEDRHRRLLEVLGVGGVWQTARYINKSVKQRQRHTEKRHKNSQQREYKEKKKLRDIGPTCAFHGADQADAP